MIGLIVVVAMIGIVAAIATPLFANVQARAHTASLKRVDRIANDPLELIKANVPRLRCAMLPESTCGPDFSLAPFSLGGLDGCESGTSTASKRIEEPVRHA